MSPKTKLMYHIMNIALFLVLVFAVRGFSAPFTAVYPQTVLVNTTLSTGNHALLFAYPFSLSQYRLFFNDSGNLYPLTQMVLDGAIVVQNYNPAWYNSIVLLNASSYGLNTSITPAYGFVAGSQKLANSGGTLYSSNGYTCLSAPSAVSYLYAPQVLSVSGTTAYFYGYVFSSTLDSNSRIGFSKTFGDVAYSSNPGVQAIFTTTSVNVADNSYITYITISTAIPQNKLMLVVAKRSTYLTVWNYTSTWYNGATGSVSLAATTYYANIKVNTGTAVCAGLLALSTSPVPFFSASYTSSVITMPLLVYSSQPFNVTYPKTYSSLNLFLSKNVPAGSQKLTLSLPAGTVSLLDSSMNALFTLSLKAQTSIMLDKTNVTYLKLNGNVYYVYPSSGQITISPPSNPSTITFSVQDYGAGYQVLQVYDLQGRLVGSNLIGSTGQVAMNLTPYASYMITVCKAGTCKSVGLVTISSSNIQLAVMPSLPTVSQPSLASTSYDYTNKALRVNVSCTSPPCTVRIFKSVVWYNSWQMRLPVSLSQGWNLVFLKKSSSVSANGMWAYINASDWSEVRFGDSSGLPENFLTYSIIWSNTTHAQVLVYASSSGTYYLYWQPLGQVPYANISNPLVGKDQDGYYVFFDGINRFARTGDFEPLHNAMSVVLWFKAFSPQQKSFPRLIEDGGYYLGGWSIQTDPSASNVYVYLGSPNSWAGTSQSGWIGAKYQLKQGITPSTMVQYAMVAGVNASYLCGFVNGGGKVCAYPNAYYLSQNYILLGTPTPVTDIGYGSNPQYEFFYGNIYQVLIYYRSLSDSEVSQLYQNPSSIPTSNLVLWLKADPHYLYDVNWDGYVDWIDLSGNNNHATLYNFHSQGSFINTPQRQPYNMLIITQTCNTQLCSYTVNSGDPYFTVIVNYANGKMSQANTGMSVPLWQSPLGSVVTTIGKTLNLDAWGVNINDLFIFLIGLAILYSAFTYRNWELGLIVFGVWLSIGTLLLGGSGRLMVPGLSLALFGAAISYMLKREQAP